ncbi:PREDICTED: 4-coumarate--CoA ligase-like 5 [Nicrophorus vespilloides]|uniref:4-coumarate--CoA ligase-like 5 n=1 Tax=Nicrophorus vespilloides TaxID=110193 RepID=A0ABM1NGU5_NICVS|nr:PREDICTED: 4-coumarate--CoA ligase-like 5 [Nicrophorus vespilloides]
MTIEVCCACISSHQRIEMADYICDPIYDEETKIIQGCPDVYEPDPKGLGHAFYNSMLKNEDLIAQIGWPSGRTETFGSLLKRCVRTAIALRNSGVEPGDVISLCSVNNFDNCVPFVAAQFIGAVVASLDPTIVLEDTEHLVKQVNPKFIFVSQDSEGMIRNALANVGLNETRLVLIGDDSNFEDFACETEDESDFSPYEVEDNTTTAVILFSSGTTGLSKGICVHHYGLSFQAHFLCNNGGVYDSMLSYASTYWISTVLFLNIQHLFGKMRCIVPKFDTNEFWEILEACKVTFIFMAPSQVVRIIKAGRPEGVDTTSLHDIIIGGGPLSAENNMLMGDLVPGAFVHLAYGQSEATGLLTCFRPSDRRDVLHMHKKYSSCGRPLSGIQYKIVDPESEEVLGFNQQGELRFKHKCQMNGYYNLDTTSSFDADGWIKTGDIAYYDEDFCFYIVDRIKEMLKFQAFHIPPAKIEGVLLAHPQIAQAVVIGIPNEEDGDHPMALVMLHAGKELTEEDLIKYVENRVEDRYRLRAGVRFLSSLPYTPSGKVKKNQLKKMILSGEL